MTNHIAEEISLIVNVTGVVGSNPDTGSSLFWAMKGKYF
jgi:hypothetical protein